MKTRRRGRWAGAAALVLAAGTAVAGDARFAPRIDDQAGGRAVRLTLTGTAVRTKDVLGLIPVQVYELASYLQEGVPARNAETLAAADCVKQLHLAFVRDVDGATMADSFAASLRRGVPAPAFDAELATLGRFLRAHPARAGGTLRVEYRPKAGLWFRASDGATARIGDLAFARAIWGIYLGRAPMSAAIKTGLTSRL
jgi:hypothetical protein